MPYEDTPTSTNHQQMGRPMSSGERRRVEAKIESNKDLIHKQEVDLVSLSKDVEGLRAEVKSGNDRQDLEFKHMEARQDINSKAISVLSAEAKTGREQSEQRHGQLLDAIRSLNKTTMELDKRTTPPPRDSVSSLVAVAPSSLPIMGAAVHPLAPEPNASLLGRLSPAQKSGAGATALAGGSGILFLLYQILADYLSKL